MSGTQTPQYFRGIVKQVLSGDAVIIRGQPKGGPPPERQLNLSNIIAPRLARRATPTAEETKDEPWAWESREFLRKKVVGKEVLFTVETKTPTGREYGNLFLGKDAATGENLTELLISEGLVQVRRENMRAEQSKLVELEDTAKTAGKGKWSSDSPQDHVRDIKWTADNPRVFVDRLGGKPVPAVVEHVRDGSTLRLFLLPDMHHITLMLSGIRCPMNRMDGDSFTAEPLTEEAKFFTESRLLQRDIEVVLESVNNANFVGSVLHPNGNIAEALVREGFARCVDWSMAFVTGGPEKLREAEKIAKQKKIRLWKDYAPTAPQISAKDKEFTGKVTEVVNADALVLKLGDGSLKKVFLSSIRPPRLAETKDGETPARAKGFRPLYDIPWMYEAREFLRKKLVGHKVNVTVDYIQPASQSFPEKTACTITIGGLNVAEAMVAKGLATVVRYRQDDDQRSSHYDELLAAEVKAVKTNKGLHAKKDHSTHRVADISGDLAKAKQFLPFLQRAGRTDAVVEFVASGSRLRLYIPRETCLITFLLGGITCPRPTRPAPGGVGGMLPGEAFGEEALTFTRELCLQREVEVEVESMDKGGNFIGWLWVEGQNLSVALVEEGLAKVHFTAERSVHFRALQIAENNAKSRKDKMWEGHEEKEIIVEDTTPERKINYQTVVLTEVTPDCHFYAQHVEDGPALESLMDQLRQEMSTNPPLPGSYTPRRGDLCAARFVDGDWYRARVEKVFSGGDVSIVYMDYGNREKTNAARCAALPGMFAAAAGYAREYAIACAQLPYDDDFAHDAQQAFIADTANKELLLNVEYRVGGIEYVTICLNDTKDDVVKRLVEEGLMLAEKRSEKKLQKLVSEYVAAQKSAQANHLNLWRYGDVTEDDAKEFGYSR